MKKLILLVLIGTTIACSTAKKTSSFIKEDELFNSRKYIGNFIDYCHTGPESLGGPHLIWIKTTLYNTFGKLSAFGKKCDFSAGDKIYLRRLYQTPGNYGYWEYQIENDSAVVYRLSDFRYENNGLVRGGF